MKKKNNEDKSPFHIINIGTLDNPVLKYTYKKNE
jgi:hypothetical protein